VEKIKYYIAKIVYFGKIITWLGDTLGSALGSFPVFKEPTNEEVQPKP